MLTKVDDIKFSLKNDSQKYEDDFKLIEKNYEKNLNVKYSDRFMKEKKTHEVDEMSYLIARLCKYLSIENVVDVGSGKGYLSAQLSYLYDLNVIAIDSSKENVENTLERINKMKKQTNLDLRNFNESSDASNVKKFQTFNELVNVNTNLTDLVKKRLNLSLDANRAYSLIGLHTCGELANSLLMLYLNNLSDISCLLCNVACCYHFLHEKYSPQCYNFINIHDNSDEQEDNIAKIGCGNSGIIDLAFPLCSLLNETEFYLGRNARMISSQPMARLIEDDEVRMITLSIHFTIRLYLLFRCTIEDCGIDAFYKLF